MCIPDDRPQVMEGVVGLLDTVIRLLDAGELHYVFEHVSAIPEIFRPLLEFTSIFGVYLERNI